METKDGLQAAADRINAAVENHRPNAKPQSRPANVSPLDTIKFQRATRRCSVKWIAHQVKEEVK